MLIGSLCNNSISLIEHEVRISVLNASCHNSVEIFSVVSPKDKCAFVLLDPRLSQYGQKRHIGLEMQIFMSV